MDSKATKEYVRYAVDLLLRGGTLKDVKGISTDELEAVYSIAFNFYNTGKYDEADTLFSLLTIFDHLNEKYWFGLGAARQAKKDYDAAIAAYTYATLLNAHDPRPMYHTATCLLALGDKEEAAKAIANIEELADKNSEQGRKYLAKAAELKKTIMGNEE